MANTCHCCANGNPQDCSDQFPRRNRDGTIGEGGDGERHEHDEELDCEVLYVDTLLQKADILTKALVPASCLKACAMTDMRTPTK